jgi:hypothetical protein
MIMIKTGIMTAVSIIVIMIMTIIVTTDSGGRHDPQR